MSKSKEAKFWEVKSLTEMTVSEWESLCDGCAQCCLQKLEDDETGDVYYTDVHCRYLNRQTCGCKIYEDRQEKVPECVWLTPKQASSFSWLPQTCAYRLLSEGKALKEWHPLISGNRLSVHRSNISIKNFGIPDNAIEENEWQDRIIFKA
jgi:uncharacterized cysteine cluster protein YcgN (CxxCxxCC family)